jgi:hypothetical protein
VRRVLSPRFLAFALTPTVVLLLAAETTVRLKYFFSPYGRDWTYLTTPIGRGSVFAATSAPTSTRSAAVSLASREDDASEGQLVFRWQTPCINSMVFSNELGREMPRTWDEHCFRGDRVTPAKNPDEYRVVFLGGSTVEDGQSDAEMMTEQFKRALPASASGKRVTVVNAGKANFDSRVIRSYWDSVVKKFSPDLVVYYEAWNEQQGDIKFTGMRVDQGMAAFSRHRLHRLLYYRSMLYTYLVERFGLRLAAARNRFWKVDLNQLRHFVELSRAVLARGAQFPFATQIVRFPRMWKGVDTFDYRAVAALLDRLKADRSYAYDVTEISGLNQRLALRYTMELCRQQNIPIADILDPVEALGEPARNELFTDLGHLTIKGDRLVGQLIAKSIGELVSW